MKKRNRARRERNKLQQGNMLSAISGRAKPRRRAWTFERLEERFMFSTTPMSAGEVYSFSSNTNEGLLAILANELLWTSLASGNQQTGGAANSSTRALPNDPYLQYQWHLINTGQDVGGPNVIQTILGTPGEDINVAGAWNLGYTGQGIVIGVVDTGVQTTHPDLLANIHPTLIFGGNPNFNNPGNAHGTAVAGLIAAVGDNNLGVTGVAYNSQIVPINLLASPQFVSVEAALRFGQQFIDIYNNSWGPSDFVRTVDGPSAEVLQAIRDGIIFGRDGKGTIYVWASGNGAGRTGSQGFPGTGVYDSSSYDGYVASRYTIGVGGIDHDGSYNSIEGSVTPYMESGPAILVAAPTGSVFFNIGNDAGLGSGIWTTDLAGDRGSNQQPGPMGEIDNDHFPDTDFTSRFNGTSASAPIVSGVIALMLEANPNLTWRDVQEILVRSARQADQFADPNSGGGVQINDNSWIINSEHFFQNPNAVELIPVGPDFNPFSDVYTPGTLVNSAGNVAGFGLSGLIVFYEDYKPLRPRLFANGSGYTVSHGRGAYGEEYGYGHGVVDAELAVQLARQWHVQGQNLPAELTFSTFVQVLGGLEVHAAERGNMESGFLFVPGGVGGTGDDEFIDYWNEYFADDDPMDPDDGPFVDYDGPSAYNRGGFFHYEIPDSNAMRVDWVEVKMDISGEANSFDELRITLISPDGTQSELNNYNQFTVNTTASSRQSPPISPVFTDPPGTIVPDDGETLVWTFSTNRNWGERYDPQPLIDPVTGHPVVDDSGSPVYQGWQLHFENWSNDDFPFTAMEVIWHGSPISANSQRIQGMVGMDVGRDGVGARDGAFNFNRYLQFAGDFDQDNSIDFNEVQRVADPNQEPFAANVTVIATRVSDGVEAGRFVTGADGNFYFDLIPDEYMISIDPASLKVDQTLLDESGVPVNRLAHYQQQWHVTPDWFFAPSVDSDNPTDFRVIVDGTGTPVPFVSMGGANAPTGVKNINFLIDPGDQPANEVVVRGLAYADLNGDGSFNGDDVPVPGMVVFWDTNGSGQFETTDKFVETHEVMMDASGNSYNYTLVIDTTQVDRYLIGAVPPNSFWEATSPTDGTLSLFAGPGAVFNNTNFGFFPPGGDINPPVPIPGSILGVVFNDVTNDGIRQGGELGVSGIRVFVDLDSDGSWSATEPFTITTANGGYFLADIDPGTYRVTIENAAAWVLTSPAVGYRQVTVGSGASVSNVLFAVRNLASHDYGDLPDTYGTTLAANGARHQVIPGFRLGARIDGDLNGQPSADALGDDLVGMDEDGVVLLGAVTNPTGVLVPNAMNSVRVTLSGVGGYLNAWMDFNRNGTFDTGEQIFVDLDLNPGTHTLAFAAPNFTSGPIAARFRWGTAGLSYDGPAPIGEVEDYYFPISVSPTSATIVAGDYDRNGHVEHEDYLVWRASFGSTNPAADGNNDGIVDSADYIVWRKAFDAASSGGGSGSSAATKMTAAELEALVLSLSRPKHSGPTPEVAAVMESLGWLPMTVRVGIDGSQTIYYLPTDATTDANSTSGGEEVRGAAFGAPVPVTNGSIASPAITGTRSFSLAAPQFAATVGTHNTAIFLRPVADVSNVAVQLLDHMLAGIADADDKAAPVDPLAVQRSDDQEGEIELALAAVFAEENDWRCSI